jgi:hypothetical protein
LGIVSGARMPHPDNRGIARLAAIADTIATRRNIGSSLKSVQSRPGPIRANQIDLDRFGPIRAVLGRFPSGAAGSTEIRNTLFNTLPAECCGMPQIALAGGLGV